MARGLTLDQLLYGPDGKFLFRNKRLGVCPLCGAQDYVYDVGAMARQSWFCRRCVKKYTPQELRKDANIALQRAQGKVSAVKQAWDQMQARYIAKFGVPMKLLHRK